MKIGDLAALAGASRRQIRYYEDQGLLKPRRDTAGYRVFLESDVASQAAPAAKPGAAPQRPVAAGKR